MAPSADLRDGIGTTSPLLALNSEQRALVGRVAALARERFAPRATRYDAESRFPAENYGDLRADGLLGLTVPREYGGLGADPLTYALCLLEMAKGCPATALTFNMHATVLTFVDSLGTENQRRRYFGEVVEHGRIVASITSEPNATIRSGLETLFRPTDGGYHVSGLKAFCSLGDAADYYLVSGMLEGSPSPKAGMLMAMIPRSATGTSVEKRWDATGMRGTISHTIRFDVF